MKTYNINVWIDKTVLLRGMFGLDCVLKWITPQINKRKDHQRSKCTSEKGEIAGRRQGGSYTLSKQTSILCYYYKWYSIKTKS